MTVTTWHVLAQEDRATTTARQQPSNRKMGNVAVEPTASTTAEAMSVATDITRSLLSRKPLKWSRQGVQVEINPPASNTEAPETLDSAGQAYWSLSKTLATHRPTITKKLFEDIYQELLSNVSDISVFISHQVVNLPVAYAPTMPSYVLPEVEALLESPLGLPAKLVSRLKELNSYSWDDEEQNSIQVQSLLSLKGFLDEYQPAIVPNTTITLGGHIIAEWRRSKTNLLTLEFLSDGAVKFIFFHRLGQAEQQINRVSGIAAVHNLPSALNWASISSLLNE